MAGFDLRKRNKVSAPARYIDYVFIVVALYFVFAVMLSESNVFPSHRFAGNSRGGVRTPYTPRISKGIHGFRISQCVPDTRCFQCQRKWS